MGFAAPARAEPHLLNDLGVTAAELSTDPPVAEVGAELADISAPVPEAALAAARSELAGGYGPAAAGGKARSVVPPGTSRALSPGATPARLAVVAMGKCGGRELNYASDVDV